MLTISRKNKENICLIVSVACLLISALWIVYHTTFTGNTNLSEMTGFHGVMLILSVPFGGLIGPFVAPAVVTLVGFFNTANYFRSDRPAIRRLSRVALIAQGVLTVVLAVVITISLTC